MKAITLATMQLGRGLREKYGYSNDKIHSITVKGLEKSLQVMARFETIGRRFPRTIKMQVRSAQ
jgi:hypothetical protein